MERPESQDAGTIILTGLDTDTVLSSIEIAIKEHEPENYKNIATDYQVDNTSMRVLKLIVGNAKLSNLWWGIQKK